MIKDIITQIKEDCKGLINPDDNSILDVASRIYISNYIQSNKDNSNTTDKKITFKQKKFLDSLGYQGTYDLSKNEAKELIKSLLDNGKRN